MSKIMDMFNFCCFTILFGITENFQQGTGSVYHGKYDFIIAGAGVAGSVLANRLTESGRFRILLLEAGGYENSLTDVPGLDPLFINYPPYSWEYKTVPQKNACLGYKNNQCAYPQGKAIGGGSVINFMMYVRGNREDFDEWGRSNPGWDYESVLPYFKKAEDSTVKPEEYEFHGHSGPVSVEDDRYYPDIANTFLEAGRQTGREILDYNGKNQTGFSRAQAMTKNGRRWSAGRAYIQPAMNRPNLEILTNSFCTKILIRNETAYGVEFMRYGIQYWANSSKEVIISCGAINSPRLLMLSGIGPMNHLREFGIDLVKDLPVGETLQDHVGYPTLFFGTNISVNSAFLLAEQFADYWQGSGILTTSAAISAVGFASPLITSSNPSVEYVFLAAPAEFTSFYLFPTFGMSLEDFVAIVGPLLGKYIWGINPFLLHPKSKGSVKLSSSDPLAPPLIDPNLYGDENGDDMKEMLAAIDDIFKIVKTDAFQAVDFKYLSNPFPACASFERFTVEFWKCHLKETSYSLIHPVATCKMDPETDRSTVVDNTLRVHGIHRLRVADAGVIPFPIAGHPTASAYMIGEKTAEYIRGDYGDL